MKVLMIVTSNDRLGDTGHKTGLWLEELAAPYYVFIDAGAQVTLASPKGGPAPVDPRSEADEAQNKATRRFTADTVAMAALKATVPLADVRPEDHDVLFYPGGHGPLWDLVDDARSVAVIEAMHRAGKPVAAVCHGPAVLVRATTPDGKPLVARRNVTGFSNAEEDVVGLSQVVPFLLQDELTRLGAKYERGPLWEPHVVVDGLLVTGQNPASSERTATEVLGVLSRSCGCTPFPGEPVREPGEPGEPGKQGA
ncbi:type 1 glutamine amidotransferase domain-containing protein [Nitratidesulfovibrio sp. HK-II]|uniref:type 1 glutamine amidotransferase domain-containing protein n=1 Tax=Nitratidesulfovibrio sp. HK-II TaxID=2009266 RepID=UPI000E2F23DC|nr:type 1 glutamine amidotransferase domain-containing protein [Nitratidesulfovibrio sp. HK-II]GBO97319.1 ThiJ/PfpI family protein [Nitratidesulfovibrio sp. HK-II]